MGGLSNSLSDSFGNNMFTASIQDLTHGMKHVDVLQKFVANLLDDACK